MRDRPIRARTNPTPRGIDPIGERVKAISACIHASPESFDSISAREREFPAMN
jgi:hypothetical protein